MTSAKDIHVAPLDARAANEFVRKHHYSGKVTKNSQLHLGVWLDGKLGGVMQFGPSLDKRRIVGLVKGTKWNGFLELNRLAFSDLLPRNSESRALAVAFRLIRKHYPHVEWVISFADGTQCGDGTIYRASGFVLTAVNPNKTIWAAPSGEKFTDLGLRTSSGQKAKAQTIINRTAATDTRRPSSRKALALVNRMSMTKGKAARETGASSMKPFRDAGWKPLPGFQMRYIYFLNPAARERLTCPVLPFSKIDELGASMYKGERISRGKEQAPGYPSGLGGSTPTPALHKAKAPA